MKKAESNSCTNEWRPKKKQNDENKQKIRKLPVCTKNLVEKRVKKSAAVFVAEEKVFLEDTGRLNFSCKNLERMCHCDGKKVHFDA